MDNSELLSEWRADGTSPHFGPLMNAREVPVAREFWVNEYASGGLSLAHPSLGRAAANRRTDGSFIRTIHVREVLPGEGA